VFVGLACFGGFGGLADLVVEYVISRRNLSIKSY
jgi:hypothetical protein